MEIYLIGTCGGGRVEVVLSGWSGGAIILGISTLVHAPAGKPRLLGYYAHCPLAPVSTAICWAVAGAIYWLGRRGRQLVGLNRLGALSPSL